jgi:hypothetical protein
MERVAALVFGPGLLEHGSGAELGRGVLAQPERREQELRSRARHLARERGRIVQAGRDATRVEGERAEQSLSTAIAKPIPAACSGARASRVFTAFGDRPSSGANRHASSCPTLRRV